MIGASCCGAALIELALVLWLLDECRFLIPYRAALVTRYGPVLLGIAAVLFVNLCGFFYFATRAAVLKDTGRKLAHLRKGWPPQLR